jgi:hypothetical protein
MTAPRPHLTQVAAAGVRSNVMEDCRMADMIMLTIDPEFQSLIPPLQEEERGQLEGNLLEEGCRDALVVWAGESPTDAAHPCQVPWVRQLPLDRILREVRWLCPTCGEARQRPYVLLDGHHRYTICQRYEMPFAIVEAPAWVKTREEASIWIIQNQLGRRNLEDYQRIELAERLRQLLAQRAKEKQREGGREKVPQTFAQPGETRQAIADMAGVSRETVRKAEIIMREADEPTKQALRAGERSIQSVYHELRPSKPQPTASVNDEETAAQPPLVPPSTRVGPDASVDQHAPAVRVTIRSPGHETAELSVESASQCDGPSAHQADLGTPAQHCLTLIGELYAALRTMEELHDLAFICHGWSQQTRAEYLHQCGYLIVRLQAMQQALQNTIPNVEPAQYETEAFREAAHPYHGGGVRDAFRGDKRHGVPPALEGAVAASRIGLEEEGKKGEDGLPPSANVAEHDHGSPLYDESQSDCPLRTAGDMTTPIGAMAADDVKDMREGGKATASGPRGKGAELTQEAIAAQAYPPEETRQCAADASNAEEAVTDEPNLQGEEMSANEGRSQGRQRMAIRARIATEREAGASYGTILKRLNAEHIPTPSGGGAWHKEAVRRLYQEHRQHLRGDGHALSIDSTIETSQDKQLQ